MELGDQPGGWPGVTEGRSRPLEIKLSGMREAFSRLCVTLVGEPVQECRGHPLALEDCSQRFGDDELVEELAGSMGDAGGVGEEGLDGAGGSADS